MSYLEPRGGQTPSGGRASGQPDVPAPYGLDVPAEEPDPYASPRRQAAHEATESGPSWNAFTPGPATTDPATTDPATTGPAGTGPATTGPAAVPPAPPWEALIAATSTSQAEWELTAAEAEGARGPGRRRAGRDGRSTPKPAAICPPPSRSGSA